MLRRAKSLPKGDSALAPILLTGVAMGAIAGVTRAVAGKGMQQAVGMCISLVASVMVAHSLYLVPPTGETPLYVQVEQAVGNVFNMLCVLLASPVFLMPIEVSQFWTNRVLTTREERRRSILDAMLHSLLVGSVEARASLVVATLSCVSAIVMASESKGGEVEADVDGIELGPLVIGETQVRLVDDKARVTAALRRVGREWSEEMTPLLGRTFTVVFVNQISTSNPNEPERYILVEGQGTTFGLPESAFVVPEERVIKETVRNVEEQFKSASYSVLGPAVAVGLLLQGVGFAYHRSLLVDKDGRRRQPPSRMDAGMIAYVTGAALSSGALIPVMTQHINVLARDLLRIFEGKMPHSPSLSFSVLPALLPAAAVLHVAYQNNLAHSPWPFASDAAWRTHSSAILPLHQGSFIVTGSLLTYLLLRRYENTSAAVVGTYFASLAVAYASLAAYAVTYSADLKRRKA